MLWDTEWCLFVLSTLTWGVDIDIPMNPSLYLVFDNDNKLRGDNLSAQQQKTFLFA